MRVKALIVAFVLGLGILTSGCGTSKQGAASHGKRSQQSSSSKSGGKSSSAKSRQKSRSSKSGSKASAKKPAAASPKATGTTTASGNPTGTNAAAAALFQRKCQVCHGTAGVGASAPKLDAGLMTRFTTQAALQSFVKKNMPFNDPGTLSDAQAAALARYLWSMQKP